MRARRYNSEHAVSGRQVGNPYYLLNGMPPPHTIQQSVGGDVGAWLIPADRAKSPAFQCSSTLHIRESAGGAEEERLIMRECRGREAVGS